MFACQSFLCVFWELWSQEQVNLNFAWQPVYICTVNRESINEYQGCICSTYRFNFCARNLKPPYTRAEHWAVSAGSMETCQTMCTVASPTEAGTCLGFYRRHERKRSAARYPINALCQYMRVLTGVCWRGSSQFLVQDLLPSSSFFFCFRLNEKKTDCDGILWMLAVLSKQPPFISLERGSFLLAQNPSETWKIAAVAVVASNYCSDFELPRQFFWYEICTSCKAGLMYEKQRIPTVQLEC